MPPIILSADDQQWVAEHLGALTSMTLHSHASHAASGSKLDLACMALGARLHGDDPLAWSWLACMARLHAQSADQIVVMANGAVVEVGTHAELSTKLNSSYLELMAAQELILASV